MKTYLDKFHKEYPDIRAFQDQVESDLVKSGTTFNLFGRRCVAEIFPHFNGPIIFDVELPTGNWFRVYCCVLKIEKKQFTVRLQKIIRLAVTVPRKSRGKVKSSEIKRTEAYEIYNIDPQKWGQVEKRWRAIRSTSSRSELLNGIHTQALWDADEIFSFIQSGPVPVNVTAGKDDIEFTDFSAYPFAVIPSSLIQRIRRPSKKSFDVAYIGYDKLRRNLISSRVSSTSMDFCKIAMTEFRRRVQGKRKKFMRPPRIVNCIHDEIAVECHKRDEAVVRKILKNCMEDLDHYKKFVAEDRSLLVKITAEDGAGFSYDKAKPK